MPMRLRGWSSTRSQDLVELPDDYNGSDEESIDLNNFDDEEGETTTSEDEEDTESDYELEFTSSDGDQFEIPQVDIQEMIALANELLRDNNDNNNNNRRTGDNDTREAGRSVSIRFPVMRNQRNLELARAIIEEHERLNRVNNNGNGTATGTLVEDYRGNLELHRQLANNINGNNNNNNNNNNIRAQEGNENGDNRPFWMKLVDSITITLFPLVIMRIIRCVLSISSFSLDVMQDTFDFIDFMQEAIPNATQTVVEITEEAAVGVVSGIVTNGSTATNDTFVNAAGTAAQTATSSLIMKFGMIIMDELPNLNNNIKIALTLTTFYLYTTGFGLFMITSFAFLILCLVFSLGKRWHSVERFVVSIIMDGEECI
ncbi:unnamed protein product [Ambrosiozyma monospora]|uniref:Unnamed protein product n=1 Tax=Ambrosiozyma monospora TaxID=43982 RepID=A0A9W6YWF3_AMBMO|nr:unnamed protein product [Ambrosiozyma monospora]